MPDRELCPCGSGLAYAKCCEPYHLGEPAPTPLALMRSRYSGYARGLVDYIILTTHPQNHDAGKPLDERKKEIEQFCKTTEFKRLVILNDEEGESKGSVTFTVFLLQAGKEFFFTEKSAFEKIKGRWLYLGGEFS
jgi:SEC-C motif-containing protein